MVDREKVLTVLTRRFHGAPPAQLAAAANAIVGLDDEWEDVTERGDEFGETFPTRCGGSCYLAQQAERGHQVRIFRRRNSGRRI